MGNEYNEYIAALILCTMGIVFAISMVLFLLRFFSKHDRARYNMEFERDDKQHPLGDQDGDEEEDEEEE